VSDKAILIVCGFVLFSFVMGVLIGKAIRWGLTGTTKPPEED
jgi:hypothetical protein